MKPLIVLCLLALRTFAQVGALDHSFEASVNFESPSDHSLSLHVAAGGEISIAGSFTMVNGTTRIRVARLLTSGALDSSFDPGNGPMLNGYPAVLGFAVQSDRKVLLAGRFTNLNGWITKYAGRVNEDGSVDKTFASSTGPNGIVRVIMQAPGGKYYIGGSFMELSGYPMHFVGRLHSDGEADFSFWNTWNYTSVLAMALQRDGKVIVVGNRYGPAGDTTILRFNTNGSRDTTLVADTDIAPGAVMLDEQERIIIGGDFEYVNNVRRPKLARLNSDGSLDYGFWPPIQEWFFFRRPWVIVRAPNRKWLVGGNFTIADGFPGNYLLRLHDDGRLDETFDCGTGPNGKVTSIAVQADGRILIGGEFTEVDGFPRSRIARLWGDPYLTSEHVARDAVRISWPIIYTNYTLEAAATLAPGPWARVPAAPIAMGDRWVVTNAPVTGSSFFRLTKPNGTMDQRE